MLWHHATAGESPPEHSWYTSLYAGRFSHTVLIANLQFDHDFEDSDVYVLSLGKEMGRYQEAIAFEIEGQIGSHAGIENHQEMNLVLTLRWLPFFWDHIIDTSFAFGNGISYATQEPALEAQDADQGHTAQWLYYILLEWSFTVPRHPQWDLFWRIHHRSGIWGLLADNNAGSNFVGFGLRYRFAVK